jgi:hypothetical protein
MVERSLVSAGVGASTTIGMAFFDFDLGFFVLGPYIETVLGPYIETSFGAKVHLDNSYS